MTVIVDDHLLLRVLTDRSPDELRGSDLITTTAWWWRVVAPLARPRAVSARHRRYVAGLGGAAAEALWETMSHVGQPGSQVHVNELVPLGPAMAWLARHEGLNRLAAEAVAAARDTGAALRVSPGNAGTLSEVAKRYDIDFAVLDG